MNHRVKPEVRFVLVSVATMRGRGALAVQSRDGDTFDNEMVLLAWRYLTFQCDVQQYISLCGVAKNASGALHEAVLHNM